MIELMNKLFKDLNIKELEKILSDMIKEYDELKEACTKEQYYIQKSKVQGLKEYKI